MNIFVGSLPFSLSEVELRNLFEEHGEVTSVKIITDKATGRSKGFGFVEMSDDDQANQAIESLNDTEVSGRKIVVNKAEERREGAPRSGGGGNFRGGGSGNRSGGGFNKGGGYNKGGNRTGGGGGFRGGNSSRGEDRDFNY